MKRKTNSIKSKEAGKLQGWFTGSVVSLRSEMLPIFLFCILRVSVMSPLMAQRGCHSPKHHIHLRKPLARKEGRKAALPHSSFFLRQESHFLKPHRRSPPVLHRHIAHAKPQTRSGKQSSGTVSLCSGHLPG